MAHEYEGVLYDDIEGVVIERSPVLRATYTEAFEDAKQLVALVNVRAEAADDESDIDSTIGRVDITYCYVKVDGQIAFDVPAVA